MPEIMRIDVLQHKDVTVEYIIWLNAALIEPQQHHYHHHVGSYIQANCF